MQFIWETMIRYLIEGLKARKETTDFDGRALMHIASMSSSGKKLIPFLREVYNLSANALDNVSVSVLFALPLLIVHVGSL
jgi:hypothetical protein